MSSTPQWNRLQTNRAQRLARVQAVLGNDLHGKIFPHARIADALHAVLEVGDRVCLEGNNQKQADFLARALCALDASRVHDLHMLQSVLALPSHLDVFEKGIASKLDFSFSGPQAARLAQLLAAGKLQIGAIHTYLELYARYFVDLTPRVALVAAQAADRHGNLYTGPNTEDTPVIIEATAFKSGIVVAQVNQILDVLPRIDIPADWVDLVVAAPTPHYIEPLFTRDPALISEVQILMAMMAIKGLYAEYGVQRLNHGIGFDTAAIELLLPTYAASLGLRGKIATHWALNPHPALIPAIEAGFVESVHSFGSELGMENYIRARPDIFFVGADGSMRSNRALSQAAGHYACDMFIGSTLQIDLQGNSSTATLGRIAGFGGAPNMGADARGRRHASPAWLKAGAEARAGKNTMPRGKKLVVQMVESFREHMQPAFVETLDAWQLAEQAGMALPPVMIYGDDVTHILSEEGIANLLLCRSEEEREQAIRGVAGYTPVGLARDARMVENLRDRGIIRRAEDMGIDKRLATRDLLAAKNMKDLVRASGGLYQAPKRFRNW
ncbi:MULTISPECIES: malonate decarboxylase subunit alpha [unclassified Undibacterium]|uniref:malonate decarboxylase subunit alpha n=1 Tax=unclassified Undibacterium TaxID=2630295 RepID=UPI002AC95B9A|nr:MULTISPECIES: malonate decarboxylase subunit alpha [unclassified Undibacterium]MEB0137452.1 malonate decarboxylase subunit alpha [Undibacterium sp. CCC2.1]MEB0170883.1 malonate decarboxylase subunit alpha [Undibacterium sp. CCC1.1]MEB0174835.1 malonate decarboxylase subunit alpha [Undibacterium sp. CCC3.4]MEB0214171.1 malonate decarboxylase subunit alpha [Undibacterium sp. 5I2]WPX44483.1 malonate decarboxylase subunit alpha [Undibacterium sp. CCC3.4]